MAALIKFFLLAAALLAVVARAAESSPPWRETESARLYFPRAGGAVLVRRGTLADGCEATPGDPASRVLIDAAAGERRWLVILQSEKGAAGLTVRCAGVTRSYQLAYHWQKTPPFFHVRLWDPTLGNSPALDLETARTVPAAEYLAQSLTEQELFTGTPPLLGWAVIAFGYRGGYADADHTLSSPVFEWQPTWAWRTGGPDLLGARLGFFFVIDRVAVHPVIFGLATYRRLLGSFSAGADLGYGRFLGFDDQGPIAEAVFGYRLPPPYLVLVNEIALNAGASFFSRTTPTIELQLRWAL